MAEHVALSSSLLVKEIANESRKAVGHRNGKLSFDRARGHRATNDARSSGQCKQKIFEENLFIQGRVSPFIVNSHIAFKL